MPVSRKTKVHKPVLVGESNPYGSDPYFALYPAPDGCSGHRLCNLILGMHCAAYLEVFDRVNLCNGPWSLPCARQAAIVLMAERVDYCKLILCGSKVAAAFGVAFKPFTVVHGTLLRIPHPSGLCRLWGEEGAVDRARAAVAAFVPEVAHLIGVTE